MLGGVEWGGPSHSAVTNMLYVPAVDWCTTFVADAEPRYIPGKNYLGGTVALAAASGTPSGFWVDRNGGAPTIVVFAVPEVAARE